jgi:hypothetical protein
MAIKHFSDAPENAKRVEFSVDFIDQGRTETHQFAAFPAIDALALAEINRLAASNNAGNVKAVLKVKDAIRKMLDDNDGTPLDWQPSVLPDDVRVPTNELAGWPGEEVADEIAEAVSGELHSDESESVPQFLAPDGTVHPLAEAFKFEEFSAGSSRRRWVELVDGDNNLTLKATTVMKIWRWLISEVAERPTVR